MNSGVSQPETPEAFLKKVADDLSKKRDFDAELAEILSNQILQAPLEPNNVARAKEAILKLAGQRASSSQLDKQ